MLYILGAVLIAAVLFVEKFSSVNTDHDEIKAALGGMRAQFAMQKAIGCVSLTRDPKTTSQVTNVVVPTGVIPDIASVDTVLFVFKNDIFDSSYFRKIQIRRRLWTMRSPLYTFLLAGKDSL